MPRAASRISKNDAPLNLEHARMFQPATSATRSVKTLAPAAPLLQSGAEGGRGIRPPAPTTAIAAGFVLADLEFTSIYANQVALQILSYLAESHTASPIPSIQERLRAIFSVERFSPRLQATTFLSGRRRYVCRPFLLESAERPAIVALLLERIAGDRPQIAEVSRRFHLSRRECQTVEYLVQGLTTKEVALRMNVSPNTIKQFVRLIMSKMGVTNRSGIVGKLLGY